MTLTTIFSFQFRRRVIKILRKLMAVLPRDGISCISSCRAVSLLENALLLCGHLSCITAFCSEALLCQCTDTLSVCILLSLNVGLLSQNILWAVGPSFTWLCPGGKVDACRHTERERYLVQLLIPTVTFRFEGVCFQR